MSHFTFIKDGINMNDLINILALIFSPIVALTISNYIQKSKELKDRRFQIFLTLISTRHEIITADQAKAFNSIDVIFSDYALVRIKWREYYDLLHQETRKIEWPTKKLELLQAMAASVGLNKHVIDHLDLDRIYYPVGLSIREENESRMFAKWEKFLDTASVTRIESLKTESKIEIASD